ncbi:YaaC family protein [Rossellomorea marisflavi]|uniref:YaaC-like Protein n=1 Tax=Rossellomorea marisflavi TaxID=189381 RepID=A0A0J5S2L8_9BACI|nr:YaaC family protein [Rossellomorea marisflavi]KMK91255.1 hypothetical protein VL03_20315 [Rossellomorea marisflavi]KML27666.1 hypothetical protein VL12_21045 [Rossellomorea marisflavi]KZE46954.1 hypothetical protein AV649_21335 [Rossellomorea marisflavi]USK92235.1 YaaC family protein [Rossellomorea marisflavi]
MRDIRHWRDFLHYFQSASYTQKFLSRCYRSMPGSDVKSYDNCYPFMYYLEQGEIYYKQAEDSPLSIRPILLFYGFIHFIKAVVLTTDPNYPETTTVLAHGITSRKRKKQQYRFLHDEVKIQKNGLFNHFSSLHFDLKHLEGEKYKMEDLLDQIPEMADSFKILTKKTTMFPFSEGRLAIDDCMLSHFHWTPNAFRQHHASLPEGIHWEGQDTLSTTLRNEALPFRWDRQERKLALPAIRNEASSLPEVLIHYAILYNLSMIARYETEWWMELLKNRTTEDYPFILAFITLTTEKGPSLLGELLENKMKQEME